MLSVLLIDTFTRVFRKKYRHKSYIGMAYFEDISCIFDKSKVVVRCIYNKSIIAEFSPCTRGLTKAPVNLGKSWKTLDDALGYVGKEYVAKVCVCV